MQSLLPLIAFCTLMSICQASLFIYEHPEEIHPSDKFTITLSQASSAPRSSFVYMLKSDHRANVEPHEAKPNRTVSWTSFAFHGRPITAVISTSSDFRTCLVRPSSYGFSCRRTSTRTAEVVITHNTRMISIEFDIDKGTTGQTDIVNKLLIFADAPEQGVPTNPNAPNILYYGKGVHDITGGQKLIQHHITEVYIAPGAYVHGAFNTAVNHPGCRIHGRGILSGEKFAFKDPRIYMSLILMDRGRNHEVNGLVLVDPSQFYIRILSRDSIVDNIKTVAPWNFNSDGIVVGTGGHVEDSFIMANDDALKIYGSRITARRCVIWQSHNGGVFQFGWWRTRTARDVEVSDIDVIHTDWCAFKGNRCGLGNNSALMAFGRGTEHIQMSNLVFRDVRLEGSCPRLFNFQIQSNATGSINGIRLVNWNIEKDSEHPRLINKIAGNENLVIRNWRFENFVVNGNCLRDLSSPRIETVFTSNISFNCN